MGNGDGYGILKKVIPPASGSVGPLPGSPGSAPPASVPVPSGPPAPSSTAAASDPFVLEIGDAGKKLLTRGELKVEDWSAEADRLLVAIERETRAGGRSDPAKGTAAFTALTEVLEGMIDNGDPAHTAAWVDRACLAWWDAMTAYQIENRAAPSICYRAMAGYILARNRVRMGDRGGAVRWAALAHLADRIDGHPGRGGADLVLRNGLGIGANVVAALDAAADDALAKVKKDWSDPRVSPELCLAAAIDGIEGGALVAPTTIDAHHLARALMRRALTWALDEPKDPNSKGERLEILTRFLGGTIAGARAERSFNALGFSCEHDVVVRLEPGHSLPGGSSAMLVECKNWLDPLGASGVGYFLARMKFTGIGLGLLVAKSGITDTSSLDDAEKNARSFLVGFCQRENIACLVLTRSDLERLIKEASFDQVLREKYTEFTFGRKKSHA